MVRVEAVWLGVGVSEGVRVLAVAEDVRVGVLVGVSVSLNVGLGVGVVV